MAKKKTPLWRLMMRRSERLNALPAVNGEKGCVRNRAVLDKNSSLGRSATRGRQAGIGFDLGVAAASNRTDDAVGTSRRDAADRTVGPGAPVVGDWAAITWPSPGRGRDRRFSSEG